MRQHRYKPRNFDFAQQLLNLRKRSGLTQEEVAFHVGVTEKAVRNWEGGSNYPADIHLRKLIELYLTHHVFTSGHEQEEARVFWGELQESTQRRISNFEEQWFAALLAQWHEQSASSEPVEGNLHPPIPPPVLEPAIRDSRFTSRLLRSDWSETLDVSAWYGRVDELAELKQWILEDRCRLVAILGMGGIGKTTLTVKLIQQLASQFEVVLWRSLQHSPSIQELLLDWLPILSEQRYPTLPEREEQALALLIELLQERRCLLVLDNLETLFQGGELEGRYRAGYEGYATLIQRVAETRHQSCLILTSRELFTELGMLAGRQVPVRLLRLRGLPLPASQQLLQDKELFGKEEAWRELVERYAGNPLALKIVAETVRELFGGDITAFLTEGFTTFYGIRQLLAQQFERLSELEQTLLYWLAIVRELTSLENLRANLFHPAAKSGVVEAMHSLCCRNLVERGEHGAVFTLQPVVLEYVTERLIALMSEEICECRPVLLFEHVLLQGHAKDYVRTSQVRLLIQPLLDRLMSHFGNTQSLEVQFDRLLQQLRAMPRAQQGYGGGNIINLLVHLNGHVQGKDYSQLTVWQADLQEAEAQGTSFSGSDLMGSTFIDAFDSIMPVALSPNGQYLAGGSNTGQIRVWRVADGQPALALLGHTRLTWSLVFNSESTRLMSGGYDGLVKVWEISSGQCLRILRGHTKWVRSMTIHPAGRLLATGSDDGSIRLWDLTVDHYARVWHEQHNGICSVAFSSNGRLLASGDANGVVKVWDLASEQCLWSVTAHRSSGVLSIAFSPDSQLLVSGGEDTTIVVLEASSGVHLNTLAGHTGGVHCVAFHAEGLLASSSFDRTIKIWQIEPRGETAQCLGTLYGHSGWVWSISFGPERLLASGGQDGMVKLWQINERGTGARCLRTLRGYARVINAVVFNPDGSNLVTVEHNRSVKIWDTKSGQCLRTLRKQAGESSAAAFHPDGRLFAHSFDDDRTIKLWDIESRQVVRSLQGHQATIWSMTFSPDGRFLLSCSLDATIKRWEVNSGRCLATFEGHGCWVWSIACSPDGMLLASGDVNGVIKLWDVDSGQCLRTLQGSFHGIVALMFAHDGQTLLSSNAQDLVTVWDVQGGRSLKTIPGIGDTYWLRSVAFSADGTLLAAESRDRTIKVWDVSSGLLLRTFPCHAGRPRSVAFSADRSLLACGTEEGTVMLWERQTGSCLMTLQSERPYEHMDISDVTGITEAQRSSLKALGAIEGSR